MVYHLLMSINSVNVLGLKSNLFTFRQYFYLNQFFLYAISSRILAHYCNRLWLIEIESIFHKIYGTTGCRM